MKILITGGLGYIGGRLANYLIQKYPQLLLFLTTRRKDIPVWAQSLSLLEMDLTDPRSIEEAVSASQPEIVIHLGALSQDASIRQPAQASAINVDGTAKLVDACGSQGIKRFVYLSTSQVYGFLKGSISENTAVNPQNPYVQTKYEGENIVHTCSDRFKIRSTILRLSNSYGRPADHCVSKSVYSLAFNAFCQEAVMSQQIRIKSNQYRNFICMEDVVGAIDFLVLQRPQNEFFETFNVGSQECLSIRQAAERVGVIYQELHPGHPVNIINPPAEREIRDYVRFEYRIDKLLKSGFELKNDFRQEIMDTLKFFEEEKAGLSHG